MFLFLNGKFLVPPTLCSLSFTSLQVFQLWSHSVDTLLEERVCSPAPTSNSCLSSSFLDEHIVLASFCHLLSLLVTCFSAQPFSCLATQCLYFLTTHLFITHALETHNISFLCTSPHLPDHFLSCIHSLFAALNPFHYSIHALISPPTGCTGVLGTNVLRPAPLLSELRGHCAGLCLCSVLGALVAW